MIRFRFSPAKARAALLWMVEQQPGIDLHTALKACYFADKRHINEHGRPVFGATYRAMRFGPVPLEIYEMAKGDAIWLAELGADSYPWSLQGYRLNRCGNEEPEFDAFSESDMAALRAGFDLSRGMTFNERTAATHGDDWQAANLGLMAYEDMLEDSPEKAEKIEYLRATAHRMRL